MRDRCAAHISAQLKQAARSAPLQATTPSSLGARATCGAQPRTGPRATAPSGCCPAAACTAGCRAATSAPRRFAQVTWAACCLCGCARGREVVCRQEGSAGVQTSVAPRRHARRAAGEQQAHICGLPSRVLLCLGACWRAGGQPRQHGLRIACVTCFASSASAVKQASLPTSAAACRHRVHCHQRAAHFWGAPRRRAGHAEALQPCQAQH